MSNTDPLGFAQLRPLNLNVTTQSRNDKMELNFLNIIT